MESPDTAALDAKRKISTWLSRMGVTMEVKSAGGYHWIVEVSSPCIAKIVHPAGKQFVSIIAVVGAGNPDAIAVLPEKRKKEIRWELTKWLMLSPLEFGAVAAPFESIMLQNMVFLDAITEDLFYHRFMELMKGANLVKFVLGMATDEAFEFTPAMIQS